MSTNDWKLIVDDDDLMRSFIPKEQQPHFVFVRREKQQKKKKQKRNKKGKKRQKKAKKGKSCLVFSSSFTKKERTEHIIIR
jgi:hypothetical protein